MLFIRERFLVYKLETFKTFKEVKHIMITTIVYIFVSYVIFDQQLKITFRKSSGPHPLKKSTLPFLLTLPCKNSKSASPPFIANIENLSDPSLPKGGKDTMQILLIWTKLNFRIVEKEWWICSCVSLSGENIFLCLFSSICIEWHFPLVWPVHYF